MARRNKIHTQYSLAGSIHCGFVLFIGCVAYEKYCCSIFEGKCYTFILRTRIVWIFLHKQPATQTTSVLFWDVSLKNTEVKLSLSFSPVTPSPLIALHRPQFNEAISFAGTPMQDKCAVLINTGCLIAILPWNFASFIYIMFGAVIVTLPCPVSRIPSAAQSAHPLVWYHSGTVLGHWCQMPVMRTHIAPVSIIHDGKWRKCLLGLHPETWGEEEWPWIFEVLADGFQTA